MRKLPSHGQDFVTIRKENLLYVDKTEYVYKLIRSMGCYFLSRPRRFGKSLLLGAMTEALKGNRELFEGLWLGSSDYDFKKYPVVKLTMTGSSDTSERLEATIMEELRAAAVSNGQVLEGGTPDLALKRLVRDLNHSTGDRVAVLIDEYDEPIRSNISEIRQAKINRQALCLFYNSLKTLADDGQLRLLFVTGETKLVQDSILSGFNFLGDLTLNRNYNGVCGFTCEEFDAYFADYLPGVLDFNQTKGFMAASATVEDLRVQILDYYGGYSWDGKGRILNPLSLIKFIQHKKLLPYWLDSGISNFLSKVIFKYLERYVRYSNNTLNISDLNVDVARFDLTPLLFQTGYLTIDRYIDSTHFKLEPPNKETRLAFTKNVINIMTGQKEGPGADHGEPAYQMKSDETRPQEKPRPPKKSRRRPCEDY
jgi:hypothetical protein